MSGSKQPRSTARSSSPGIRIGPADVGRRVVLRHLLPDGRATDVLGELTAWGTGASLAEHEPAAVVLTRNGTVRVPLSTLLLGKVVPPAPQRRSRRATRERSQLRLADTSGGRGLLALHDVMADGWQPLERAELGGWRLRAAQGFTGRANSVLPLGLPPGSGPTALAAAVDSAEQWYAGRSLPARFCLPWPLGSGPGEPAYGADPLERELLARGYELDTPTLVMTRACSSAAAVLAEGRSSGPISAGKAAFGEHPTALDVRPWPDDAWLALYHYRGQELPPVAIEVLTSAPAQAFISVRAGGRAIAVGRVASSRGWAGLTAIEVATDQRRRGWGRVVVEELLRWGEAHGDHAAYLQVARSNTAAIRLYEQLGFSAHSGYHYRIQPASDPR